MPDAFLDDTPTTKLIRKFPGSEFEKAMVISKLRRARDRKRATGVRVEGPQELRRDQSGIVALGKQLRRYKVQGRKRTLRETVGELAEAGFITDASTHYAAAAIAKMIISV